MSLELIQKRGPVLAVCDQRGDMPQGSPLGYGLYRSDTRFLSTYELRLNGLAPLSLGSGSGPSHVVVIQMVNPELASRNGGLIPRQTLSLRRTRFLRRGLHERIALQNCGLEPVEVELRILMEADYQDIFEVRGHPGAPGPRPHPEVRLTQTGVRFDYRGRDGVLRATEVSFEPVPRLRKGEAEFPLRLAPRETFVVLVDALPFLGEEGWEPGFEFERALEEEERAHGRWHRGCTSFEVEGAGASLFDGPAEDLRVLSDELPTGPVPTAGVPWFAAPFGRDALITSIQTLVLNPELAFGTLRFLAAHQGRLTDAYREEEPGKILHEIRRGELANLGLIPHTPYFGSVDATPLFLDLLVDLVDWTGDLELFSDLEASADAALEWIDRHGDLDGDGLVDHVQRSPGGLRNQGWKDSWDSLTAEDGSPAALPASLVEVQAYVYKARRGLARILRSLGRLKEAALLEQQAAALARRFDVLFWMPRLRYYAQALDGDKRQVRSLTSNPGHALWGGIVPRRRARAVVRRLLSEDLFSGWGVRTLSRGEPSYNPMSYHNGSIWPHDNSIIAAGLRCYGFDQESELVARSILEASMRFEGGRLPELFCGFERDRRHGAGPERCLVSCLPQAWAAGAPFHLLQTLLGVTPRLLERTLRIAPLATPLFDRVRVEGMRVGDTTISFTVRRRRGGVGVKVDRRPPGLRLELPA